MLIGLIVWGFIWGGPMAGGIIIAFVLGVGFLLAIAISHMIPTTEIDAGMVQEPVSGFECPNCGKQSVMQMKIFKRRMHSKLVFRKIDPDPTELDEDLFIDKRIFQCKACGWKDDKSTVDRNK